MREIVVEPETRMVRERSAESPEISIVVPVFNEDGGLQHLVDELVRVLQGETFELVLVNDGSTDRSGVILHDLARQRPEVVVVELARNFGQHAAVVAGFSVTRGQWVVTLDADLQNPPEEVPRLIEALRAGHDVVGSVREDRQDHWLRKQVSSMVNTVTTVSIGVGMRDYGCMLRAYSRDVVLEIVELAEQAAFVPALAMTLATNPVEIEVKHKEREEGASKYSPLKLLRLGFDLITGFSLLPIQLVSLLGLVIAVAGGALSALLFGRRIFLGPESDGLFTLFAILFAFMGVLLFAVGLVGEYVGRIYAEVRRRPIYRIREVISQSAETEENLERS